MVVKNRNRSSFQYKSISTSELFTSVVFEFEKFTFSFVNKFPNIPVDESETFSSRLLTTHLRIRVIVSFLAV